MYPPFLAHPGSIDRFEGVERLVLGRKTAPWALKRLLGVLRGNLTDPDPKTQSPPGVSWRFAVLFPGDPGCR